MPPCSYSYNAFGLGEAPSASNPPVFFFGGARRHEWTLPPATVSVWPFEAMYAEEDPDVATEVRSIIECVLTDQIGPAVRDLGAAAEYRRKERGEP